MGVRHMLRVALSTSREGKLFQRVLGVGGGFAGKRVGAVAGLQVRTEERSVCAAGAHPLPFLWAARDPMSLGPEVAYLASAPRPAVTLLDKI